MPKQQTNNKMFNRKKSKACYDKHDPSTRIDEASSDRHLLKLVR